MFFSESARRGVFLELYPFSESTPSCRHDFPCENSSFFFALEIRPKGMSQEKSSAVIMNKTSLGFYRKWHNLAVCNRTCRSWALLRAYFWWRTTLCEKYYHNSIYHTNTIIFLSSYSYNCCIFLYNFTNAQLLLLVMLFLGIKSMKININSFLNCRWRIKIYKIKKRNWINCSKLSG